MTQGYSSVPFLTVADHYLGGAAVLASITLIVPFGELCQPGQPAPYSAFPFIALAFVAAAAVIACFVVRRHPRTGAGEGTAFPGA
ncbi:MAG: hypothetical protein ACRDRJ_21725 [Streptosporangiaceae bacterium]